MSHYGVICLDTTKLNVFKYFKEDFLGIKKASRLNGIALSLTLQLLLQIVPKDLMAERLTSVAPIVSKDAVIVRW